MITAVNGDAFRFATKFDQTILLGVKAQNIRELLDGVRTVPDASVYFHTHRFLQQHHFLSPEPPNDFAYWTTNILNESALGERMSSVDVIQFRTISDLRNRFTEMIEDYLQGDARIVDAPPGEEFHFMSSRLFVAETPYTAHNLTEFRECLRNVSIQSLYYHMFDARLRLPQQENDFSLWFKKLGLTELAEQIKKLDPYTQTLEGLRQNILKTVQRYDNDRH